MRLDSQKLSKDIWNMYLFVSLVIILSFHTGSAKSGFGQITLASLKCLEEHNQMSFGINFMVNCFKKNPTGVDSDSMIADEHACFMMRWYCTRMCTNLGKCPVRSVSIYNISDSSGLLQTVDCKCGYTKCMSGCKSTYGIPGSKVDDEFMSHCSSNEASTTTTTSPTTSTTTASPTPTSTTTTTTSTNQACEKFVIDEAAEITFDPDNYNGDPDLIPVGGMATVNCTNTTTLVGPHVLKCISPFKWDYDKAEFPNCSKDICPYDKKMEPDLFVYDGMYADLYKPLTKIIGTDTEEECANYCLNNEHLNQCVSAFYNKTTKNCSLAAQTATYQDSDSECYTLQFKDAYNPADPINYVIVYYDSSYRKMCSCLDGSSDVRANYLMRALCLNNIAFNERLDTKCASGEYDYY